MEDRLKYLSESVLKEEIEKGQVEAQRLVDQATQEAEAIRKKAVQEAEEIMKVATRQAEELSKNTASEITLASTKAVASIKQEIESVLSEEVIGKEVKKALKDEDYTKKLLGDLVKAWAKGEDITVYVNPKKQQEIEAYFTKQAKSKLDKSLTILPGKNVKAGFEVQPSNTGYKVSFTDESFSNYLKGFFSPRLVEMLFGNKKS